MCRMPSTTRVSNPSPPTLTHSESELRDFERRMPTSDRPYVCTNWIAGNSAWKRRSVLSGMGSVP